MLYKYIKPILYISGTITMLPILQFLVPNFMLQQQGLAVADATGLLFAQHWGLLVFCIGALLVYAAKRPPIRAPIIFFATLEKLGLIILVALNWQTPSLQGFHLPVIFDSVCVLIFSTYLLNLRTANSYGRS